MTAVHGPEPVNASGGYEGELGRMSQELQTWCHDQGLPWESACDLVVRPSLTIAQADWLVDFIGRWDSAVDGERPCPMPGCGYRFDLELLGRYGCPNCNGEGLDTAAT